MEIWNSSGMILKGMNALASPMVAVKEMEIGSLKILHHQSKIVDQEWKTFLRRKENIM